MLKTSFNKNWNGKLLMPNFGTIRLHNTEKYYQGADHEIYLNEKHLGTATVYAVKPFKFGFITDSFAWLDASMPAHKLKAMLLTMYKNKVNGGVTDETFFVHVVFHWKTRIMSEHQQVINTYWNDVTASYQDETFLSK